MSAKVAYISLKHSFMRFLSILIFVIACCTTVSGQLTDDFSDGNLTANPTWVGDLGNFVVNANKELQLMAPVAGISKLYTQPVEEQDTTYWRGYLKMDFAPSATNLLRYYLQISDTSATASGYYFEIGENGNNDAMKFYRLDTGKTTLIGSCKIGALSLAPAVVRYEIKKFNGNWQFFTNYTGGTVLTQDSSFVDATYSGATYKWTGYYCLYTDTRKDKFFFDELYIGGPIKDLQPPSVIDLQVIDNKTLKISFSEALDGASATNPNNYTANNGLGNPTTATIVNANEVQLLFSTAFQNFLTNTLSIKGVRDVAANQMVPVDKTFTYSKVDPIAPYDLLINEIMADPTPVVGLPDAEFIEIFNNSNKYINLNSINLQKGATNYRLPAKVLAPKQYVIVCDDAVTAQLTPFGTVAELSNFPSLTNTGDKIALIDTFGNSIHSVQYSETWYGSPAKKNGGYTLELINPQDICVNAANNWSGSNAAKGGTPGTQNSIFAAGNSIFEVLAVKVISTSEILVTCSKTLHPNLVSTTNFLINNTPNSIIDVSVLDSTILLQLATPLKGNGLFELQMNDLFSCNGLETITVLAEIYLEKPKITQVKVVDAQNISVEFSLPMLATSVGAGSSYVVDQGIGNPTKVTGLSPSSILLNFTNTLSSGLSYNLKIQNVLSAFETTLKDTTIVVKYFTAAAIESYDLLVNEVMADPSPTVGLPDAEYIEIYKNTPKYINLKDLVLKIGSTDFILPDYDFKGNTSNYVLVFAQKAGLNFGSSDTLSVAKSLNLTNDGTTISIWTNTAVIDEVSYSSADYRDSKKAEGGWSLERIFNQQPCRTDSLFSASKDLMGGTPGRPNSIATGSTNTEIPAVSNLGILALNKIRLDFSVKIEKALLQVSNFEIDGGLNILSIEVLNQGSGVEITFNADLQKNKVYQLTIKLLEDCVGNRTQSPLLIPIANPDLPKANELVINEILYDPVSGGVDFIEIYNNSSKVFNLNSIQLANLFEGKQDIEAITSSKLIFPGDHVVVTSVPQDIKDRYTVQKPGNLLKNKLPSFNDGAGNVSLLVSNIFGFAIIDSINYDDKMHAPFLNITSGVSLERINPGAATSNRNNWHSAASTAGYATPTYQNSQYFEVVPTTSDAIFTLPITTFSPDGDGFNDFLTIQFKTEKPGYQATIRIYDAQGRLMRKLLDGAYLSNMDHLIWQGETDENAAASLGIYVLDCRLVHSDGTTKHEKLTCVLAKKLE